MSSLCPPLSIFHLDQQAPVSMTHLSDACVSAKALVGFFSFWLGLRCIHLIYTGYRLVRFRQLKGKWRPLLQHYGIFTETAEDILFIVANTMFLSGSSILGFCFTSIGAGITQISNLTSTYLICSKLTEGLGNQPKTIKFSLTYTSNVRIAVIASVCVYVIDAIRLYAWKQHDISMFSAVTIVRGISSCILGLWLARAVYMAGKDCESLISEYGTNTSISILTC